MNIFMYRLLPIQFISLEENRLVFITLDKPLPTISEHGHQHFIAIGIINGLPFVFDLSSIFGV